MLIAIAMAGFGLLISKAPLSLHAAARPTTTILLMASDEPEQLLRAMPATTDLPTLRRKYRALSRPVHPDAPDGGDEDAFLALTKAYEERLRQLAKERRQPWLKAKEKTEADEELEASMQELQDVLDLFAKKQLSALQEMSRDPAMRAVDLLETIDPAAEAKRQARAEAQRRKAEEEAELADASWKKFEAERDAFRAEQTSELRKADEDLEAMQAKAKAILEGLEG